jgi:hypothetical protein
MIRRCLNVLIERTREWNTRRRIAGNMQDPHSVLRVMDARTLLSLQNHTVDSVNYFTLKGKIRRCKCVKIENDLTMVLVMYIDGELCKIRAVMNTNEEYSYMCNKTFIRYVMDDLIQNKIIIVRCGDLISSNKLLQVEMYLDERELEKENAMNDILMSDVYFLNNIPHCDKTLRDTLHLRSHSNPCPRIAHDFMESKNTTNLSIPKKINKVYGLFDEEITRSESPSDDGFTSEGLSDDVVYPVESEDELKRPPKTFSTVDSFKTSDLFESLDASKSPQLRKPTDPITPDASDNDGFEIL